MNKFSTILCFCTTFLLAAACSKAPEKLPEGTRLPVADPITAGLDSASLAKCDSVINLSIRKGNMPGAVVCIVKDNHIVYEKAYGRKQIFPNAAPMTTETVFDLASVSKCLGTTLSFMQLVEKGLVSPDDYVDSYIPDFAPWTDGRDTVRIKIKHLLTHSSGLEAVVDVKDCLKRYGENQPDSLRKNIATELPRLFRPGTGRRYSCPNLITVQYILEEITGQRLCDYATENIYRPLGLCHTWYHPVDQTLSKAQKDIIAPTEVLLVGKTDRNQMRRPFHSPRVLKGDVHDPTARRLNGGNSGNAGLFSNADDMAVLCAAILNGGEYDGVRILKKETVDLMCRIPFRSVGRALGWDAKSPAAKIIGEPLKKDKCICHTGYTGPSVVLDFDENLAIILLANRVHPYDDGSLYETRVELANIVGAAVKK